MVIKSSRGIVKMVAWTVLTVLLFFFCNASFRYSYMFAEQFRMFEWDCEYALHTIFRPMGLVTYIADFLIQFYARPFVGAFVTALLFLLVSLGLRCLLKRGPVPYLYIGICLIPGLIISILGENQYYHLENSLTMSCVVMFLNLYIRISIPVVRALVMILGGWFIYYTSGAAFISFLLVAVAYEMRMRTVLRWTSLACAAITLLPIVALLLLGKLGTPANVLTPACYMSPRMPLELVYYSWLIMTIVAIVLIQPEHKTKVNKVLMLIGIPLQMALLVWIVQYCYDTSFNKKNYVVMQADYLARQGQWNELIDCTSPMSKNQFIMSYQNYALSREGILAEKGFSRPQMGGRGLIVPFNNALPVMLLQSDFNYAIGNIALAQRYAFETFVLSREMGSPRMLVRLIQTNLITGAYGVAEKYISRLEHTLYYKDIAQYYRRFLYNDTLVAQDAELGSRRKGIMNLKGTEEKVVTPNILYQIYQSNPENGTAFQYLSMIALFARDLPSLQMLVDMGKGTKVVQHLPMHVQEGLLLLHSKEPEQLETLSIAPSVKDKFEHFMDLYARSEYSREAYNELQSKYKHTYWFYFFFKR